MRSRSVLRLKGVGVARSIPPNHSATLGNQVRLKLTVTRWSLLLATLVLPACASHGLVDTGQVAITTPEALPAPAVSDLTAGARPHFVGPFDQITVDVLGLPELSRQLRVDASGHVQVPIAGAIDVTGKTPEQLAAVITDRMRERYVKNPQVTVTVNDTVSQTLTVDGQVRTPGVYPVLGRMTLMKAIASAQGTTDIASTNHVIVFRRVEGKQMAALYDLRAIRMGAFQDPPVYINDVVVVGESEARRLFPQILQAAGLLMTPLVTVLRN